MSVCQVEACGRPTIARRYCSMHYQRWSKAGEAGPAEKLGTHGERNPHWKGGRVRGGHQSRYWMRHVPAHPRANSLGYVLEHRLVAESMLGRPLEATEIVHHRNGDSLDNRPENLEVMTQGDHARLHHTGRARAHH